MPITQPKYKIHYADVERALRDPSVKPIVQKILQHSSLPLKLPKSLLHHSSMSDLKKIIIYKGTKAPIRDFLISLALRYGQGYEEVEKVEDDED